MKELNELACGQNCTCPVLMLQCQEKFCLHLCFLASFNDNRQIHRIKSYTNLCGEAPHCSKLIGGCQSTRSEGLILMPVSHEDSIPCALKIFTFEALVLSMHSSIWACHWVVLSALLHISSTNPLETTDVASIPPLLHLLRRSCLFVTTELLWSQFSVCINIQ